MRILCVGKSDFNYNRTAILIEGLQQIDSVEIELFRIQKRNSKTAKHIRKLSKQFDCIYVPPFRQKDVPFIKRNSSIPVIFDPLITKYITQVVDYKKWWKAPIKYWGDQLAMRSADILVADTQSHAAYWTQLYGIASNKIITTYIGVNASDFAGSLNPIEEKATYTIGFYGSFVPLQGTDIIIEAAALLKDHSNIQFEIIGSGYTFASGQKIVRKHSLTNIQFQGWVKSEALANHIQNYDICLGIFGDSKKAKTVIPNKIYHYLAMAKPTISMDSIAMRELFNENSVHLIPNSAQALANAIVELIADIERRKTLAKAGFEIIHSQFKARDIAEKFIADIQLQLMKFKH